MKFSFQHMTLEAPSLYALIAQPVEMQLEVDDQGARIVGYGFTREIDEAFTLLVLDWEATVQLDPTLMELEPGEYSVFFDDDQLYAARHQRRYAVPDQAVRVEVTSVPEA